MNTKPIADLFPHCTVIFADICGFSAWSSEREPEQVFTLLETVFRTFDKLARNGHFQGERLPIAPSPSGIAEPRSCGTHGAIARGTFE
jgi:hypothetical protein